jgi:hypothetical protein
MTVFGGPLEEVKIEGVEVGLVQSRTRPRGVTRTESPTSPDSVTSVYSHEAAEFESIHASWSRDLALQR